MQNEQVSSPVETLTDVLDKSRDEDALRKQMEIEAAERARVDRERLAARVKDFGAEKTRLERARETGAHHGRKARTDADGA